MQVLVVLLSFRCEVKPQRVVLEERVVRNIFEPRSHQISSTSKEFRLSTVIYPQNGTP